MTKSQAQPQDSIAVEQDADLLDVVHDLQETVHDLQETVGRQQETIQDQQDQIDRLRDELQQEREQRARDDAEQRQRLTDAEERIDDVEETDSTDTDPTPDADKPPDRTPIERLSDGDKDDVAQHVTPSIERAVCLFESLRDWGKKTPKGYTLRPADSPKKLLEAARDESLAWQQYYRAAEALERLSKGAITFFDHQKHGKMVCLHADTQLHERQTTAQTSHSRPSLARGD